MVGSLTTVLAILMVICHGPESQAAAAQKKVVISHSGMNARYAHLWAARERGFFAKYGMDTDVVFVRSGPIQVASIVSGDVQIGYAPGATVLVAAAEGAKLKILATFHNQITHDLVGRPGMKSLEELRGKRLGLQSIGGSLWLSAMLGLEKFALDPHRDNITLLVIGDQTVLTQALETGTIDAAPLDPVFSRRLKDKGFPILAELFAHNIPTMGNSVMGTQGYLEQHPEVAENMLRGLIEGLAFSLSPANKSITLKMLMKRLRITDPSTAEQGYTDFVKTVDRKPYPSPDGLRNIQRLMKARNPKLERVRPEDVIDDRILRKLDESGFIDRLYSSYGVK
ncbi:MAG: ABC transporter substrate-binding protein [Deltaproteobacteria bacterium]|nr:ABC transporter substrate-binding protein [Deltaproteobacteria bacterium]